MQADTVSKKQKYYVVWAGRKPGVYDNWDDCEQEVRGFAGARYKAFETLDLAKQAFNVGPDSCIDMKKTTSILKKDDDGMVAIKPGFKAGVGPVLDAIAVDAACSGNPGVMEYQGVYIASGTRLFHFKTEIGTNNIGEFLAIVHGLAFMKQHGMNQILYSDSVNAINWVKARQCRTKLPHDAKTENLYNIIHRAEAWLCNNKYSTEIRKWDTEKWGEIPADFNRKH